MVVSFSPQINTKPPCCAKRDLNFGTANAALVKKAKEMGDIGIGGVVDEIHVKYFIGKLSQQDKVDTYNEILKFAPEGVKDFIRSRMKP
ncbi:MAG: hypothetical protein PHE78_06820 [Candidatus Gastranaerophilales bacterium]|nr:hypothetical protein [Candidatus Gastranaerophilales bacterium]